MGAEAGEDAGAEKERDEEGQGVKERAEEEEGGEGEEGMSEVVLRCIKKLVGRVNVLPVRCPSISYFFPTPRDGLYLPVEHQIIARSDELTTTRLAELKAILSRDLARIGVDFGVFGSPLASDSSPSSPTDEFPKDIEGDRGRPSVRVNGLGATDPAASGPGTAVDEDRTAEVDMEGGNDTASEGVQHLTVPPAQPIKLLRSRSTTGRAAGRRSARAAAEADDEGGEPVEDARALAARLPFALVAPEGALRADGRFVREFR